MARAVDLIGVIGDDESGAQLKNELAAKGIHSTGLITDPERRTTTKMRVVTTRNQQVSRIDFESDHEVGAAIEDAIASQVEMRARSAQVILVSDYQKGVVTRRSMAHLVAFAQANGAAGDRRSEGAAHRLLRRRRAGHAEPHRGRERDQQPHLDARGCAARLERRCGSGSASRAC